MKNFLVGLGIGAALGIAFAPARGRETRDRLRQQASDWAQTLDLKANELRETAGQWVESRGSAAEPRLNTVSREQLLSVYGIGPVIADRIIENRPYRSNRDVVEQGIISESLYQELQRAVLRKSA